MSLAEFWLGRALDTVLPPLCLSCRAVVDRHQAVCAACWSELRFIGPPCCERCGVPFAFAVPGGTLCPQCLQHPPAFDAARAVLLYDEASRKLVLGFKHADRTECAPTFVAWLARAGRELLADDPVLVPVPLHWRRLVARRYNQAALLARGLARATRLDILPDAISRRRATPSQGRLGARERARNVKGAFAVAHPERIAGRPVLLIDDVLTSGATAEECARTLRAAGAARVSVLALARVALPS